MMNCSAMNLLVCCTGSVATIKFNELVEQLKIDIPGIQVKAIFTKHALHFIKEKREPTIPILKDEAEWEFWNDRGDPVLHIDLAKWADIILIAPLDANTLAKISHGICDNLLTCVARAWDTNKPFLFCPAMNTKMWEHPVTGHQIQTLKQWGFSEVPCVSKTLMCGDTGLGAMAEIKDIVDAVKDRLCV